MSRQEKNEYEEIKSGLPTKVQNNKEEIAIVKL